MREVKCMGFISKFIQRPLQHPEMLKRKVALEPKTSLLIHLFTIINHFKKCWFLFSFVKLFSLLIKISPWSVWYSHSWETTTVIRSTTEPSVTTTEETAANPLSRPRRLVSCCHLGNKALTSDEEMVLVWVHVTLINSHCLFPNSGVTQSLGMNPTTHKWSFSLSLCRTTHLDFLFSLPCLKFYKWSNLPTQGPFNGNHKLIYCWRLQYFTSWNFFKQIPLFICIVSSLRLLGNRLLISYPRE